MRATTIAFELDEGTGRDTFTDHVRSFDPLNDCSCRSRSNRHPRAHTTTWKEFRFSSFLSPVCQRHLLRLSPRRGAQLRCFVGSPGSSE